MQPKRRIDATLLALGLGALLVPAAFAQSELPTAEPSEVGLDPGPLESLATRLRENPGLNIHSVLVVRHGKLAFERYFSGHDEDWGTARGRVDFDRETLHDLRSVSKSITAALVGIALGEGRLPRMVGAGSDGARSASRPRPVTEDASPRAAPRPRRRDRLEHLTGEESVRPVGLWPSSADPPEPVG